MRKDDALVELAEIKKDLPHWPDEVIKPWLRRVSLAKKTSTALSQDAEVGVDRMTDIFLSVWQT
jgi:hypothetical protein